MLGLVTGALAIRSSGIYFAMITVAFSQMIYFFCLEAPFTHGEDGIQAVPQGRALGLFDLSNPLDLYVFVAVVFLFGFLRSMRIVNSPFGEILKAIRENEPRVDLARLPRDRYKLAAFILSAAFAGLAGATKAIVAQNASLTDVAFAMSGEVVLMTLLGGMGTFYGPVVGALDRRRDAELPRPVRRVGDGDPGRRLRRLRAGLPPRDRRRAGGAGEGVAVRRARLVAAIADRGEGGREGGGRRGPKGVRTDARLSTALMTGARLQAVADASACNRRRRHWAI